MPDKEHNPMQVARVQQQVNAQDEVAEQHEIPEQELIRRAGEGDKVAFKGLVDQHHPELLKWIASSGVGRTDAEDIAQDIWLKSWTRLKEGLRPNCFGSWLHKLAHDHAVDFQRRRQTHKD